MECSSVPYTNKSLVFLWLTTLGLFGLTASGAVTRSWLPLLLLVGLAAPAVILRNQDPVAAIARSRTRSRIASARDQSPSDLGAIDVYRWENEGGTPAMDVSGGIREPAHAARNDSLRCHIEPTRRSAEGKGPAFVVERYKP
jgi:hypothetical protein